MSSRSPKNKTKQEQNGDREQASNSKRTKRVTKRWFSKLFENFRNYKHKPHNLKWPYMQMGANLEDMFLLYYEFARECKFIRYCINQNTTLNLLFKARIKSTPLTLQQQLPEYISLPQRDKKCATKDRQTKARQTLSKGIIQHDSIKRWLMTSSLKNYLHHTLERFGGPFLFHCN